MQVQEEFERTYGATGDGVWFAPGRVNLIGEHTDYNDGFVLPLALEVGVTVAARRTDDGTLRARSVQEGPDVVCVALDELRPGAVSGWAAYVAGVVWALREAGHDLRGLELVCDGNVPRGAGLSSSAALECSVGLACDELHGLGLDRTSLALLCRTAENDFVGAPTGVMDQMASLHGRRGHAIFLDTRSLQVEPVPWDLDGSGLALLVVDSRAPHSHADGEYVERRRSCERAAAALGVPALRDVPTGDGVDAALARIEDDVVRRRARHVVTENARVLELVRSLRAGEDPRRVGHLLTASHASMRDDFEITVPQVDVAVEAALAAGAHGARMTGGGFGGCVLALVESSAESEVLAAVEGAFADSGFDLPVALEARAADGARRLAGRG